MPQYHNSNFDHAMLLRALFHPQRGIRKLAGSSSKRPTLQRNTSFTDCSPARDLAQEAGLKEVGAGRQAYALKEGRVDNRVVELQQGHIIVMAVLFIVGVLQDTAHLEGDLTGAADIQKILAKVDSPDSGGSQSARQRGEQGSQNNL